MFKLFMLLLAADALYTLTDARKFVPPHQGEDTCTMISGAPGRCVIPEQCRETVDIMERSDTCASPTECCPLPRVIDSSSKGKDIMDMLCGMRYVTLDDKSIAHRVYAADEERTETEDGEFPWNVAVFDISNKMYDPVYKCGGSLIHPQVVLTSAHTVKNLTADDILIYAGVRDIASTDEVQEREVKEVMRHPEFDPVTLRNDVALLFLKNLVDLDEHTNIICLPSLSDIKNNIHVSPGTSCTATGWGAVRNEPYNSVLNKVELPIVEHGKCQAAMRRAGLTSGDYEFELHKSFICAGGKKDSDTCKGDGGSPLVCPVERQDDRYVQVGVVSWGLGCGAANIPGVYADLSSSSIAEWIDKTMNENGHIISLPL